jgi:MSHA biogenesis protein MshQ
VNSSLGAEGSTTIRGGRVHLFNAYGSELLDLPMTMRAEYWNGAGWVQNTDDNCTGDTTLDASNAVSLVLTNPSALATCVWDSGNPGLSGVGCITAGSTSPLIDKRFRTGTAMAVTGSPSFLQKGDFNLWFKQPGVSGSITVTANVPAWLEYGWTSLTNADPVGRATFGLYKSPLIYRRENY